MVTTPKVQPLMPPLENGDRLSWSEFERCYQAMPNLKKAELVEGIVYLALLSGNMMTVLSVLQQGLTSPAHQVFSQQLT